VLDDDLSDWIVAAILVVVFCGLMLVVARWLLNVGFGPK
jgi:hypothetical protein